MELKLNEDGFAVVENGMPVYVHSDGNESAFDAPGTLTTIKNLNSEAKNHRIAKENAESSLKEFAGIGDPAAARSALETIRNLGDKKLIEAGEVDRVRAEAVKAVEDKYAPLAENLNRLTNELYAERVGGNFARSKFINEKCSVPADIIQARFGPQFKDEDGKAVGYDVNGNKIYSRENPGETASFDEALGQMIDRYAYKDALLKGTGGGSGAKTASGGSTGGAKTMTRAELDVMSQSERAAKFKDGFKVID